MLCWLRHCGCRPGVGRVCGRGERLVAFDGTAGACYLSSWSPNVFLLLYQTPCGKRGEGRGVRGEGAAR